MLDWRIVQDGSSTRVLVYGAITEVVDFGELRLLRGDVTMDLAGVTRVNSAGVRTLLQFLRELAPVARVRAERCSPAIVMQLDMLPALTACLEVLSVLAPVECPGCGQEALVLVEREPRLAGAPIPAPRCEDCSKTMSMAVPESVYFVFWTDLAPAISDSAACMRPTTRS